MRELLAILALSGLATSSFAQTTWYVDVDATPPGDGSAASPFVSIQVAIEAAGTGDTVLVAPGDYAETLDFGPRDVLVLASGGPLVTFLRPGDPSDPVVVTLGNELGLPTLAGFHVRRDPPTAQGSGVRIPFGMVGRVDRCIVSGHGTGVFNEYDLVLERSTITANGTGVADGSGIGIHRVSSSILWGNSGDDVTTALFSLVASYCDVGGLAGVPCAGTCPGNFDADPLFWDDAAGDMRLRPGSPCIDTGDPMEPPDPDATRIEVGAVPFDPSHAPGTSASCFGGPLICPCGNGGSGAGGCDNFQGTGGFVLTIRNFAPDGSGGGTTELLGAGYPLQASPGSTLIRSPALETPPAVFGDGLRCIATAGLVRVGATVASGGTSLHTISHGAGVGLFHYQVWVRSNPGTFCNPEAFNLSNAVSVNW